MNRFNISSVPWAQRAERELAADFFKLERSHEEIHRLNIEIRRLHVHIFQCEMKMQEVIDRLEKDDPDLAVQMKKRQSISRARNIVHLRRLEAVEGWEEFSGNREPLKDWNVRSFF